MLLVLAMALVFAMPGNLNIESRNQVNRKDISTTKFYIARDIECKMVAILWFKFREWINHIGQTHSEML